MLDRVRHHVPQSARELAAVGDRVGGYTLHRRADVAGLQHAVQPVDRLARQREQRDRLRLTLERGRLRLGQLAELGNHAREAGGRGTRLLQLRAVGGHDAIDHGLDLRLQHGRRGCQVVGQVARRAPAQQLGALEAIGHAVEGGGEIGRLGIGSAGRPRPKVAGAQAAGGHGHLSQRPRQPIGQERGCHEKRDDGDDADQHQGRVERTEKGRRGIGYRDLDRSAAGIGGQGAGQGLRLRIGAKVIGLEADGAIEIHDAHPPTALAGDLVEQALHPGAIGATLEPLFDDRHGKVQPLLLTRRERLVQRARCRAVHHHARQQQHDQDDCRQERRQPDRE